MVLAGLSEVRLDVFKKMTRDPEVIALARQAGMRPEEYISAVLEQEAAPKSLSGFRLKVPKVFKRVLPSRESVLKAARTAARGAAAFYTGGASEAYARKFMSDGQGEPAPEQTAAEQTPAQYQAAPPQYKPGSRQIAPPSPGGFLSTISPTMKIVGGVALVGIPLLYFLLKRRAPAGSV